MSALAAARAEIAAMDHTTADLAAANDRLSRRPTAVERAIATMPTCPVNDYGRVEFYSRLEASRLANRPVRHCRGRELITQYWMKAERKHAAASSTSVREAHIGQFYAQLAMGRVAREMAKQKGFRLP